MSYYGWGLNPAIVGRVLSGAEVDATRQYLTLRYADGKTSRYRADGDCCSHSWIEHLTVPPDIEGATITGVTEGGYVDGRPATEDEYAQMRESKDESDIFIDVVRVYQSSIQTDRGEIIVEYRNSSNGYYGGSLYQVQHDE